MFNPNNTILAGQPRPTLQLWLTQAQAAYMQLVTGGKPVSVAYDGKSVTYTAANQADLAQWIGLLQRQLGINRGRRALRPFYR
jgi:gpW protein